MVLAGPLVQLLLLKMLISESVEIFLISLSSNLLLALPKIMDVVEVSDSGPCSILKQPHKFQRMTIHILLEQLKRLDLVILIKKMEVKFK